MTSNYLYLLLAYLFIVNMTAFFLYGLDKGRARRQQWRISEKALFIPALLGGCIGAILGMHFFHHKTKHWYFRYGLPLILICQVAAAFLIWRKML